MISQLCRAKTTYPFQHLYKVCVETILSPSEFLHVPLQLLDENLQLTDPVISTIRSTAQRTRLNTHIHSEHSIWHGYQINMSTNQPPTSLVMWLCFCWRLSVSWRRRSFSLVRRVLRRTATSQRLPSGGSHKNMHIRRWMNSKLKHDSFIWWIVCLTCSRLHIFL